MEQNINLSKKQKEVVKDLQDGFSLITSNDVKGAWLSRSKTDKQYHINNGIFRRLVDKGIIHQQLNWPFDYVLTNFGASIKT